MCDLTFRMATLEPPPPVMHQLLGAAGAARTGWTPGPACSPACSPAPEFFAPDHVARLFDPAAVPAG